MEERTMKGATTRRHRHALRRLSASITRQTGVKTYCVEHDSRGYGIPRPTICVNYGDADGVVGITDRILRQAGFRPSRVDVINRKAYYVKGIKA